MDSIEQIYKQHIHNMTIEDMLESFLNGNLPAPSEEVFNYLEELCDVALCVNLNENIKLHELFVLMAQLEPYINDEVFIKTIDFLDNLLHS